MARTIASLAVSLGLNKTGFDKGMDEAAKKTGGFQKGLGTVAKGVGIAAGAVAAAGGTMLAMASKTSAAADEIDKMSIRTGISRQQLQELRFAAGQTGVSFGAIEAASTRLTGTLRTNEEAFEGLGVATRDNNGELKSTDEIFNDTIRTLAEMDNVTERNIIGQELFGRGFTEMIPLIEAGADGIEGYAKQAHELGSVLSDEAIEANVKFQDSMDSVKTALQGAFQQTMTAVLPILQKFLDWVLENMPAIQETISTVMSVISTVVETAFSIFETYVLPALEVIFKWVQDNLPEIQRIFNEVFERISTIVELFVDFALTLWDLFGETIMSVTGTIFETISGIIDGALTAIGGILDFFIGLFTGDWELMASSLEDIWDGVWKTIDTILSGAWEILKTTFGKLWDNIKGWFDGLAKSAYEWGANMIKGFIDGIKSMIGGVRDASANISHVSSQYIGYRSPAKKGEGRFVEQWGENMIKGFLDGMNRAVPDLHRAMNDVMPSMNMQLAGMAAGGSTTTNITSPITIQTLHVRNDQDIEKIAKELHSLQRRNARGV